MNKKDIALSLAKEEGRDLVEFCARWDGHDVFSALYKWMLDSDEPAIIGLPVFILVDDSGVAHVASKEEWSAFANSLPD